MRACETGRRRLGGCARGVQTVCGRSRGAQVSRYLPSIRERVTKIQDQVLERCESSILLILNYAFIRFPKRVGKKFCVGTMFVFFPHGSKKKRNCVRQARARSISNTSTHMYMFTAAVCARGARRRDGLRKSQRDCRRAEARAAVSLSGLLAVWARDGVVRREAGYCCGVRAASKRMRAHGAVCCVCRQADRLCSRLGGCGRACAACAVQDLRRTRGASWYSRL